MAYKKQCALLGPFKKLYVSNYWCKFPGKRDRGRQREKILDGMCRWLGVKYNKNISRHVRDKTGWRNMIANAFSGRARDDDDMVVFCICLEHFQTLV
jgi:hypothetical protein